MEPSSRLRRRVLDPLTSGLLAVPRTVVGLRRLAHLPVALLMPALACLVLYLVWAGLLYPLRSDAGGPGAWGGPSVAGAWAVHAGIALGLQALCLAGLHRLDRVHRCPAGTS